jgi:hypothetical protein
MQQYYVLMNTGIYELESKIAVIQSTIQVNKNLIYVIMTNKNTDFTL